MDYYDHTCHHKEISSIKAVKYLLLCTLALLLLGLVTLTTRLLVSLFGADGGDYLGDLAGSWSPSSQLQVDRQIYLLLADYCAVGLTSGVALLATLKENFFFLIASALTNLVLSLLNLFVVSFRWSIIFLQVCSSLFTFVYTLSFYLKMKLDIRRKKRQVKQDMLQHQLGAIGSRGSEQSASYDKLVLTGEWIRTLHPSESNSRASTLCAADS